MRQQFNKLLCVSALLLAQPVLAQQQSQSELPDLLVHTLKVHPQIMAKAAQTLSRRYDVESAQAQRYPSFSAGIGQAQSSTARGTLSVRQPLWTFGRFDANEALAKQNETLAVLDESRSARQLLEQTATGYASLRGLRQQLAVTAKNLDSLQALQQKIERRRDGQLASSSDVRLMRSRLAQARVQHERLQVELDKTQEELFTLSQQRVQAESDPPSVLWLFVSEEVDLLSQVQAVSPELRYQQQLAQLVRLQIDQVARSATPTVYAQVERPIGNVPGVTTTTGIYIESRIADGGMALRGQVQAATARLEAAEDEIRQLQNQLGGNVRTLHLQAQALAREQDQLRVALDDAQQTYASYLRQFEAGYKSWLDVLNMQREVLEQGLAIVNNQTQRWTVGLRLSSLLGHLETVAVLTPSRP